MREFVKSYNRVRDEEYGVFWVKYFSLNFVKNVFWNIGIFYFKMCVLMFIDFFFIIVGG